MIRIVAGTGSRRSAKSTDTSVSRIGDRDQYLLRALQRKRFIGRRVVGGRAGRTTVKAATVDIWHAGMEPNNPPRYVILIPPTYL